MSRKTMLWLSIGLLALSTLLGGLLTVHAGALDCGTVFAPRSYTGALAPVVSAGCASARHNRAVWTYLFMAGAIVTLVLSQRGARSDPAKV